MERERPEYLPPIERRRWTFPWLLVIGLVILVLAGYGVKQHLATQAAWEARFANTRASEATEDALKTHGRESEETEREAVIKHVRAMRDHAEQQALERATWRCIDGTPFRKIPGGWENVPGQRC